MSSLVAPLALHAGKMIITKFIKGRRVRFCPNCKQKINIRGTHRRSNAS